MDQPSKVTDVFCRHKDALKETVRCSGGRDSVHLLVHIGVLGFLIMVALLKWMMLPPSPFGIGVMLPPVAITSHIREGPVKLPSDLKIIAAQPPADLKVSRASGQAVGLSIQTSMLLKKSPLLLPLTAHYWLWLKPLLISAEVIPFIFFLWNGLRAYQISNRQRDWVMKLMGAYPSDIYRLLHYRAALLALGASGIGWGGVTLLATWCKEIPFLPGVLGWSVVLVVLVVALLLSILAYCYPPNDVTDPML